MLQQYLHPIYSTMGGKNFMKNMLAVVKTTPGDTSLSKVVVPYPSYGEVLIRVCAAAICGTDIHIYDWNAWAQNAGISLPLILGHECSGVIEEVGPGVTNLQVGDRVAVDTHIPCGHCRLCLTGRQHICQNLKLFGVHIDGCFADYAKVPATCVHRLSDKIPFPIAALFEPLGTAFRGVQAVNPAGKTVAVIGCGPIGLLAIASARVLGAAKIIAVEPSKTRLQLAQTLGAHYCVDPMQIDPGAELKRLTNGYGVDAFIEASGNPIATHQAFQALMKGGKAAFIGLGAKPLELNIGSDIVFKEATVRGIHGRLMFETWETLDNLVTAELLNVGPVITHTLPLSDFDQGINLARLAYCGKVILQPQGDK
mgnify:CR=1 FL=1